MKTIQQLLELSKNPFYRFTNEEAEKLDDFLLKNQDTTSPTSAKKRSKPLSNKTRVVVRNVVKKADTYPPEASDEL